MSTTTTGLFATACLSLAAFQTTQATGAEARLKDLETKIADLQRTVDAQAKDATDAKALAEKGAKYAETQAKAAAAMMATLEASEKAGFTFGINPDSRVVLLQGWREALMAAQTNVPAVTAPGSVTKAPANGR